MESYGLLFALGVWSLGLAFGSHMVWRIPVLIVIGCILLAEVIVYFVVRWMVRFVELLLTSRLFNRQNLQRRMQSSRSYQQWARLALELDKLEGRQEWKERAPDPAYHPAVLRAAVAKVRAAREDGDAAKMMEHLRLCLSRNFGGYMNEELYTKSHVGTKQLVDEFVNEVEGSLMWLAKTVDGGELDLQLTRCAEFVHDSGASFGTTCLFLSGGAALGFYHLGILRGLLAEGLLPNLVCGTSMGSICAAYLAVRTDEEALRELKSLHELYQHVGPEGGPMQGSKLSRLWRVVKRGYMYEHEEMLQHLEWFTKGLTFAEAHARTGRVVSITCTPEKTAATMRMPPLLLNHIVSPTVTIASAVMASSCVPGLIPLVKLQEKVNGVLQPWRDMVWALEKDAKGKECHNKREDDDAQPGDDLQEVQMRDGSFESDVPIEAMRSLFNTHFSIVSQVNPHIIPFFYYASGAPGRPIRWPWRHYRGGFITYLIELWLKEDMVKNFLILQKTGLLFNIFGVDWSYLFTQQDHGETTIVPNAELTDYFHVLDNVPSFPDLERIVRKSERNVWRNFSRLQARIRLQRALRQVGESVLRASKKATPGVRDAVLRQCGPAQSEAFRVCGCVPHRSA